MSQTTALAGTTLALCARLDPDALSLDLAMPGRDGHGVLRALRQAASPIPVVVVSAFSQQMVKRAVDVLAEALSTWSRSRPPAPKARSS